MCVPVCCLAQELTYLKYSLKFTGEENATAIYKIISKCCRRYAMGIAVVNRLLDRKIVSVSQRNSNWKQSILLGEYRTRKTELKLRIQIVESNCDREQNTRGKLKRSATGSFPEVTTVDIRWLFQDPYTSTSLENSIRQQGHAVICWFEKKIWSRATRTG